MAASHGHADIVRYLLEHGADPHQSLKDSTTCLLEATKNGQTNCVEVLLDYSVSMCPLQCGRGVLYDLSSSKTLKSHQNNKSCNHSKTINSIPKVIFIIINFIFLNLDYSLKNKKFFTKRFISIYFRKQKNKQSSIFKIF